jgi:hypothetical protein
MKKKNTWYEIPDIDQFIESTRVLVFDHFGKKAQSQSIRYFLKDLSAEEAEEINSVLTQKECMVISQKYITNKKNINTINDKKYFEMIEAFNTRLVSNLLQNLVSKGLIESAFDTNINDFVFWTKTSEES